MQNAWACSGSRELLPLCVILGHRSDNVLRHFAFLQQRPTGERLGIRLLQQWKQLLPRIVIIAQVVDVNRADA